MFVWRMFTIAFYQSFIILLPVENDRKLPQKAQWTCDHSLPNVPNFVTHLLSKCWFMVKKKKKHYSSKGTKLPWHLLADAVMDNSPSPTSLEYVHSIRVNGLIIKLGSSESWPMYRAPNSLRSLHWKVVKKEKRVRCFSLKGVNY